MGEDHCASASIENRYRKPSLVGCTEQFNAHDGYNKSAGGIKAASLKVVGSR
jgi:hypothetical protein